MGLKEEYAERAAWALWRLQRGGFPGDAGLSQTQLGAQVAKRVGRKTPFSQATVRGWLEGSVPRDFETQKALADELGVDEIWLYFNRGEPPQGWLEFLAEADYRGRLQEEAAGREQAEDRRAEPTTSRVVPRGRKPPTPKRKRA